MALSKPSEEQPNAESKSLPVCGIVMPISAWGDYEAQHWLEVKEIISRAITSANMRVRPVWESSETDIIHGRIVKNLYESDMVVCDISGLNPNVMFELGMRLTFRKPVVIVADSSTHLPFDTGVIDTLSYPSDLHFGQIERFMNDLSDRIISVNDCVKKDSFKPYLDTFGAFTVVEPQSESVPFQEFIFDQFEAMRGTLHSMQTQLDKVSALSMYKGLTQAPIDWNEAGQIKHRNALLSNMSRDELERNHLLNRDRHEKHQRKSAIPAFLDTEPKG